MTFVKKYIIERDVGYTVTQITSKIRRGVWREGIHFEYDPDGEIMINFEEIQKWVKSGQVSGRLQNQVMKSPSRFKASDAAKESNLSPAPLI